jgi:uncharacterized membrane protein YbhN (UPF0104 family)
MPHVGHRVTRATLWAWARVIGGIGIVALLAGKLGTSAFLDGIRVIDAGTLLAALGIGLLTTILSAWRWRLVAHGLGLRLPLAGAVADYYRALFLNAALPGGILGDVDRAVRHGRDSGDVGRGVRAVVLERSAGQVMLVGVALAVLVTDPASVLPQVPLGMLPWVAGAVVVLPVVVVTAARGRFAAWLRTAGADLRHGLCTRDTAGPVVLASALVLAGHLATFVVAARAAGLTAPLGTLLPLMLLALLAMGLPLNVGGWGPREGALAWAFGAAGLGAAQGLTVAVVYGVLAFAASLPGAGVLLVRWLVTSRTSEPVGQGVPQQDHVTEPAHLGEVGASAGAPRERTVTDEPRRPRVAHEDRRDHQVQLVRQTRGQELRVHRAATLDHQPAHPAGVQVRRHPVQVDRLTAVDDRRHLAEPIPGLVHHRRRTVDELVVVPGGEELR